MTCIAGIVADDGYVWIGADSASADGWKVRQSLTPKVFNVGEVLIGYTVSYRMGQILQAQLELPDAEDREAFTYIMGRLVDRIRTTLQRHHWGTEKDNKQEGCALLVGYRGHLFCIGDEYQVTEEADGFDAIGCGGDFALGAMYAASEMAPADRILMGLKAAAHMSGGVMPPFRFMCVSPDGTVGSLL